MGFKSTATIYSAFGDRRELTTISDTVTSQSLAVPNTAMLSQAGSSINTSRIGDSSNGAGKGITNRLTLEECRSLRGDRRLYLTGFLIPPAPRPSRALTRTKKDDMGGEEPGAAGPPRRVEKRK